MVNFDHVTGLRSGGLCPRMCATGRTTHQRVANYGFSRDFYTNQGSGVPFVRRTAVNRESSPGRVQVGANAAQGSCLTRMPQRDPFLRRAWGGGLRALWGHEAAGVVEIFDQASSDEDS
jgi:hypothetical protein